MSSRSEKNQQKLSSSDFEIFVKSKIKPHLWPIAFEFWAIVAREAPELVPGMRGGTEKYIPIPVWRSTRDVIALSPSANELTISFANGFKFDDPEGHLGGAGKVSRTIKLRTLTDLSVPSTLSFVRQAAEGI